MPQTSCKGNLTPRMCTWAQVFGSDFSVREAAQRVQNIGLQDQLVDSADEGCFHYCTLLQTLHVWRTVIQIPHCPICPVCSASYPRTCFQFLHKAAAHCCQSHHFPVTQNVSRFRIWYLILSKLLYQAVFSSVLFLGIHQTMVVTDSCVFLIYSAGRSGLTCCSPSFSSQQVLSLSPIQWLLFASWCLAFPFQSPNEPVRSSLVPSHFW